MPHRCDGADRSHFGCTRDSPGPGPRDRGGYGPAARCAIGGGDRTHCCSCGAFRWSEAGSGDGPHASRRVRRRLRRARTHHVARRLPGPARRPPCGPRDRHGGAAERTRHGAGPRCSSHGRSGETPADAHSRAGARRLAPRPRARTRGRADFACARSRARRCRGAVPDQDGLAVRAPLPAPDRGALRIPHRDDRLRASRRRARSASGRSRLPGSSRRGLPSRGHSPSQDRRSISTSGAGRSSSLAGFHARCLRYSAELWAPVA